MAFPVCPIGFSGGRAGEEAKRAGAFAADMFRSALDIVLQQLYILENGGVDALQDIVPRTVRKDAEGVVDKAAAEGLNVQNMAFQGKLGGNEVKVFHLAKA